MTASWMARRWCVVEREEQHDLFIIDPWHTHLVDINMRLDVPVERTLCGDLLPARPVFSELLRSVLPQLCPECLARARSQRIAGRGAGQSARSRRAGAPGTGETADEFSQIDLEVVQGHKHA